MEYVFIKKLKTIESHRTNFYCNDEETYDITMKYEKVKKKRQKVTANLLQITKIMKSHIKSNLVTENILLYVVYNSLPIQ